MNEPEQRICKLFTDNRNSHFPIKLLVLLQMLNNIRVNLYLFRIGTEYNGIHMMASITHVSYIVLYHSSSTSTLSTTSTFNPNLRKDY